MGRVVCSLFSAPLLRFFSTISLNDSALNHSTTALFPLKSRAVQVVIRLVWAPEKNLITEIRRPLKRFICLLNSVLFASNEVVWSRFSRDSSAIFIADLFHRLGKYYQIELKRIRATLKKFAGWAGRTIISGFGLVWTSNCSLNAQETQIWEFEFRNGFCGAWTESAPITHRLN